MLHELDILRDVGERLDAIGLDFMLTGSMAMNYYAEPRMTRDIDLVVAIMRSDVPAILRAFQGEYYVAEEAVREAMTHGTMFNLIHTESVIKVDCVVRKSTPYRLMEFDRRRKVKIDGFRTWIVSREDLILSKIVWMRDAFGSEVQRRDILNLLGPDCDLPYIRRWGAELGIEELVEEVLHEGYE